MKKYFLTSEAVTEGHPDKVCDQISDYILDYALGIDKNSKMAVEATIKDDLIFIYGEASTKANIDYEKLALQVMKNIGYKEDYKVLVKVSNQSMEINQMVDNGLIKAGDQGIMYGYACSDTEEFMPLPIMLANRLAERLSFVRKNFNDNILMPDGKTQVTVEYRDDVPYRVDTIVISAQHKSSVLLSKLREYIRINVIDYVMPSKYMDSDTKILINYNGSFIKGGSFGDSGTTGRKIVMDTYGGIGRVGGGCFSSKDPSKVDRSAAYYARYVAKNIVYNKFASKCEVSVSYVIGSLNPLSLYIDTFNTNKVSMDLIYKYVNDNFDFSVDNIIKELDLLRPIYYKYSVYGHFGRKYEDCLWEKLKIIDK